MNTFDIDNITNTLAHEAAAHHHTRLATDKVHKDMRQHQEDKERRKLVAQAHDLPLLSTAQATRISHIPTVYEGSAIQQLHRMNDQLINTYGIGLHTLFSASYTSGILVELVDFWQTEITNANRKVTALAEGNVIKPEDLPYFLLAPTDFPKGCRRRFFMQFSFLKHYSHAVNNAIWYNVSAMHNNGYFLNNGKTEKCISGSVAEDNNDEVTPDATYRGKNEFAFDSLNPLDDDTVSDK